MKYTESSPGFSINRCIGILKVSENNTAKRFLIQMPVRSIRSL